MSILRGNAVIGQSGGPTAAINATLAGVIRGALQARKGGIINTLFGMRNGIEGFLDEKLVNLTEMFENDVDISTLELTPAAALGSCRKKMKPCKDDPDTYEKLLEIFKKYDIRYFFYIGGNDSMDTVFKLSEYANEHDYEMRVVGVPKTIDNDLMVTDHTPGFGSAAKYVAITMKEILRDVSVYTTKAVTIVEIMGRDAGWLTASAALASPDLIYLPEVAFDPEVFLKAIEDVQKDHPAVLVAISEGIKFADGRYVGEGLGGRKIDAFGHVALSGAGRVLEELVKERIGCKVRSIELNLPQRCASHVASKTDIDESVGVGQAAVNAAIDGKTAVMMTINRAVSADYSVYYDCADIAGIANGVKRVPAEYINEYGNHVTEKCVEYISPLIQGEVMPKYENGLPKHFVI